MLVDIYTRQRRRDSEYVLRTFYHEGQLQHLFPIRFNALCPRAGLGYPNNYYFHCHLNMCPRR